MMGVVHHLQSAVVVHFHPHPQIVFVAVEALVAAVAVGVAEDDGVQIHVGDEACEVGWMREVRPVNYSHCYSRRLMWKQHEDEEDVEVDVEV